jgi:hypothetical protein
VNLALWPFLVSLYLYTNAKKNEQVETLLVVMGPREKMSSASYVRPALESRRVRSERVPSHVKNGDMSLPCIIPPALV